MTDPRFPETFPPPWASAWGDDEYGLFADFEVAKVMQRCRWILPGRFLMGSPVEESGRWDDEGPQHPVELSGFWLADTACTQGMWAAVMGDNPSNFKGDPGRPVERVSWEDCRAFFGRLNGLVPGLESGFPSEAQWEYACRAGTTTAYSFGRDITPEQVNFSAGNLARPGEEVWVRGETVPVGSLPANRWGLYEMHGNVWEWCSDWSGPYGAELEKGPEGPSEGHGRVLRGGSWIIGARGARSAARYANDPGGRSGVLGFRVAPGRAGPAEPA